MNHLWVSGRLLKTVRNGENAGKHLSTFNNVFYHLGDNNINSFLSPTDLNDCPKVALPIGMRK